MGYGDSELEPSYSSNYTNYSYQKEENNSVSVSNIVSYMFYLFQNNGILYILFCLK